MTGFVNRISRITKLAASSTYLGVPMYVRDQAVRSLEVLAQQVLLNVADARINHGAGHPSVERELEQLYDLHETIETIRAMPLRQKMAEKTRGAQQ